MKDLRSLPGSLALSQNDRRMPIRIAAIEL